MLRVKHHGEEHLHATTWPVGVADADRSRRRGGHRLRRECHHRRAARCTRRRPDHGGRVGARVSRPHRGLRPCRGRAQCGARDQSGGLDHRGDTRRRQIGSSAAARRHPDSPQGQYRHWRCGAHHRGLAGARQRAREARRGTRQATTRGRRGDPGQGEPHRVRQHTRGRHAVGLQLARRPGAQRLCATTRSQGRADRQSGRIELGSGRGRRSRLCGCGHWHRDLGFSALAGQSERRRHGETYGRADQSLRRRPDRLEPGHAWSSPPHGARRRAGRRHRGTSCSRRVVAAPASAGR